MTIVSGGTTRDGQPRIDGTRVTVIDVYDAYAREGCEPAEVASDYDVKLAQVHEALAYYYNHAQAMWQYRDDEMEVIKLYINGTISRSEAIDRLGEELVNEAEDARDAVEEEVEKDDLPNAGESV